MSNIPGAISAATKEAGEVGEKILASGGNAFDAVIAAAIALAVTEPNNCGVGGEGYCTFYDARTAETGALCFMDTPCELAVPENLAGKELLRGVMAPLIPGAVAGWFALISEKCSLPAEELIEPAIRLAEEGFVLGSRAELLNMSVDLFHPSARDIFVRSDRPWKPEDRLHQPELAGTLKLLAKEGERAFYIGELAERIDRFFREAGGILRKSDLARYKPIWQKTLSRRFGDIEVHVPPPESNGYAMLYSLELLARLGYDSFVSGSLDAARTLVSVLAEMDDRIDEFAARFRPYEPQVEAEIAKLFEEESLADTVERLNRKTIACHSRMGTHTTSLSACDSNGNIICLTQTLDHGFGSGVVVPGTGVLMNNGMGWLSIDTSTKRADVMAPYQRYFLPVVPTIALSSSGQPHFAVGTPGGFGIPQTTLQVYANILFHNDDMQSALARPRVILGPVVPEGGHTQNAHFEPGFEPEVYQNLQSSVEECVHFGSFHAVQINPDGSAAAFSDPRSQNRN